MRAGDLKAGQWFWCCQSRLCMGHRSDMTRYCDSDISQWSMSSELEVELLPPDAGYDYVRPQPIDEVNDWRSLATKELIVAGDEYLSHAGEWMPSVSVGIRMLDSHRPIRRRIAPLYRQFASAVEFAPHRDRWLREKGSVCSCMVLVCAVSHVELAGQHYVSFARLFEHWVFDEPGLPDNECQPVGVEVRP